MHSIEQAFGKGCSLYTDVLGCPVDADKAALRKAYYRTALKFHPDKNTSADATPKFQAVSLAYQYLSHAETRTLYDETGEFPDEAHDVDDQDEKGESAWRSYFSNLFGKVTNKEIDAFSSKYKCSDEERRDVLQEFAAKKGDLVKMLDFVMLSEPRDVPRWVEDYLKPAMQEDSSKIAKFKGTMEKTLVKIEKMIEKNRKAEQKSEAEQDDDEEEMVDEEETESEKTDSEDEEPSPRRRKKAAPSKKAAHKAQPSKAKAKPKSKRKTNDMSDLVDQIQKRRGGGNNLWNDIGARYGVSMEDDDKDPLDDQAFAKIQAGIKKRRR